MLAGRLARAVCCAAVIIGMAGCGAVSNPSQSTPTPTTSEDTKYELQKLTERLNESMSTLDSSESMVVAIRVREGLSKNEFNRTVSTVQDRTVNFRSAFMNDRLITARATARQIRELTTIDDVAEIDTVRSGAPAN
jgi:uncharacterized protein YceK